MANSPNGESRRALGDFVRAHRARLMPADVGMDGGARRRTPGLRREEVAQLCGMSATWYSWIEQGRDVSVSTSALARLAKALRLARAERTYLFDLAGKRDPFEERAADSAVVPPRLEAAIAAMATPAYLLDRVWNGCAWNTAAAHLFVGWLDGGNDKNLLRFIFLNPAAKSLIRDWRARARRVVAEFRADYSARLDDPKMRALIDELSGRSALFARAWREQAVVGREGGERSFNHPRDGLVRYDQITFNPANRSEFKLVMLMKIDP